MTEPAALYGLWGRFLTYVTCLKSDVRHLGQTGPAALKGLEGHIEYRADEPGVFLAGLAKPGAAKEGYGYAQRHVCGGDGGVAKIGRKVESCAPEITPVESGIVKIGREDKIADIGYRHEGNISQRERNGVVGGYSPLAWAGVCYNRRHVGIKSSGKGVQGAVGEEGRAPLLLGYRGELETVGLVEAGQVAVQITVGGGRKDVGKARTGYGAYFRTHSQPGINPVLRPGRHEICP